MNQLPDTKVFLDTIRVAQSSQVFVSWQGDDPDGYVAGYLFSWNNKEWYFTRKNDSVFALRVESKDTSYRFSVSAVDNSLTSYPTEGALIGFSDKNGNGSYDNGESFNLQGDGADKSPASLLFPIRNTAPILAWGTDTSARSAAAVALPDTIFPYAAFQFYASDLDGDETIATIEFCLNDSANANAWKPLPVRTRFFTITEQDGLKTNADNVLYLRAKDIGRLTSNILRYPAEGKTWFVRKTSGPVLVIKDGSLPDADAFYVNALNTIESGRFAGKFDILDINTTKTSTSRAKTLPPFISPVFTGWLRFYKAIIWYADKNPSLDLAQQTLSDYIRAGGKVIFATEFPVPLPAESRTALVDFAPVDSISSREVADDPLAIRNGTEILAVNSTGAVQYNNLVKEKGSVLVYNLYPKVTAQPLYTLPDNTRWQGRPVLGLIGDERRMIFLHMPLHLLNKDGAATQFLGTALAKEFAL